MTDPTCTIHSSSFVDEGVSIGANTKIWHFCNVAKGAVIGSDCSLGQNVYVSPTARIGNKVRIQNNVSVYDEVHLEDAVFVGPSAVFTNVINPRSLVPRKNEYKRTLVKRGATIGANSTIVCGVTLGEFCFIGAGAVVTEDVKPYQLVVGVPAKAKGWMCECGIKLDFKSMTTVCSACGLKFEQKGGGVCLIK